MRAQMILSIYELALKERLKDKSKEKFHKRLSQDVKYLLLPTVLKQSFDEKSVYFQLEPGEDGRTQNALVYPKDITNPDDIQCFLVSNKKAGMIGNKTDLRIFARSNIDHPYYHQLKAHLIIRNCFYQMMQRNLYFNKQSEGEFVVKYSKEKLNEEQFREQLDIFERAVVLEIAQIMRERYDSEITLLSSYPFFYEALKNTDLLKEEKKFADDVYEHYKKEYFYMANYHCQLTDTFVDDVIDFVCNCYEAVYKEI